ncbi:hypothetical protein HDV00_002364 [Rhizophlyctis rosea]|nr:hypothetical protein HDV00_002364 [Rhizophlyctis rosea]
MGGFDIVDVDPKNKFQGDQVIELNIPEGSVPGYVANLKYTEAEEKAVVRKLDLLLMPWILLTTFVLNMDRTNIANAISDNLPAELGFGLDVVNNATMIYAIIFSIGTLTGSTAAKQFGGHRWIGYLMFAWGIVTWAHAFIHNDKTYYTLRFFIALTESGVIPATLVYLGGFYKSNELATRLSWFWGVQSCASAVSGLLAAGILQMRGVAGLPGWKWLFILEGIATNIIAVLTLLYLPGGPATTAKFWRKSWFTPNERDIAVTRLIRDDPYKEKYETKVTVKDFKDAFGDYRLWMHWIETFIGLMFVTPLATYLPTIIKSFGFNVYISNLLTAPPYILQFFTMVFFTNHSDKHNERGYHGAIMVFWPVIGWLLLVLLPDSTSKYGLYAAILFVAAWPITHPLNIAWMSRNAAPIGKRTVASGAIIGFANLFAIPGAYIYQQSDAPRFRKGNSVNAALAAAAVLIFLLMKFTYVRINRSRDRKWDALTEKEKADYIATTKDEGNNRLDFRFAH